jgi:peptidase E
VLEKPTTKKIVYTIAQDPADLLTQLATNDVLYVAGGAAEPIEATLPQLKDLKEKLKGKIYLGSSMGAFIVCQQYVLSFDKQDDTHVHHGLGILPVSTLCHWNVENKKDQKIDYLKNEAPNIPIITLEEGKFVTFIQ